MTLLEGIADALEKDLKRAYQYHKDGHTVILWYGDGDEIHYCPKQHYTEYLNTGAVSAVMSRPDPGYPTNPGLLLPNMLHRVPSLHCKPSKGDSLTRPIDPDVVARFVLLILTLVLFAVVASLAISHNHPAPIFVP